MSRRSVFLLSVLISGCTLIPSVGPDYAPPEFPKLSDWNISSEDAKLFQQGLENAAPWWEQFKDPVLNDLIRKAREASPTLAAAEARLLESRSTTNISISGFLPAINGSYEDLRSDSSKNTPNGKLITTGPHNTYQAGFDSTWEIDIFGGKRRGYESSLAQEESAKALYDKAGITLVSEVAQRYVDYRAFERRVEIAKRNIDIQTESRSLVKAKFDAGISSELDLSQATAQLESTRAVIPTLQGQLEAKKYRIAVLCGEVPQQFVIAPAPQTNILSFSDAIKVNQPSELLRLRPDVRSAERLLAAQTAEIGVAISDIFPKFTLIGGYGFQSTHSGSLFDSNSKFWQFGPSVTMPFFQGGKILANISLQREKTREALNIYQDTVLSALEEAQNALNSYSLELRRVDSLQKSFEASKRALELSNELYKQGLIDFLRVLDSERAAFSAEDTLIQSKQTVASSGIGVYKAFAGELPNFTVKTP